MEYVLNRINDEMSKKYELCLNSILLAKSFSTKLWYDSPHILRQFQRIGILKTINFYFDCAVWH